jgi:hypothetical protein
MRPRFAVLSVLAALAAMAVPSIAAAHPVRDRGLTIGVTPNPISAGESVLIYGALQGTAIANQPIVLYHRVNPQARYSVVSRTVTSATGFYEFPRADGVVVSNREWFVRGPDGTHSLTVHEKVSALVNVSSNVSSTDTSTPVMFTGAVAPDHAGQRIALQVPSAHGNGWQTFASGRLNSASQFTITHRFARPGIETVRAYFSGDARNIASESDSITVSVQQAQVPGFTIASSSPIIADGQTVTIKGILDQAGTNTVEPNTEVTLLGHATGEPEQALADTTTGSDGGYSFTQMPSQNMVYRVITTLNPSRTTASLYEGVADVVTLSASPTTVSIGSPVTFNGTITPGSAGDLVYLQRQDAGGFWHNVGVHVVGATGTYRFTRVFGEPGTRLFRTRVYANGVNVGSASSPVTITVTGAVAPASSLPPAA